MKIDLSEKVYLVTGGSRGIGAAIVRQLAATGATIAIHFNQHEAKATELRHEINGSSEIFQANLGDPLAPGDLIKEVLLKYGRIDGLINNAGVAFPISANDSMDVFLSEWQRTLQINLIATASLCKLTIPHFIKNGGGRIINIASRAAFRGDTPEYMAYAASKAGMVALSRSIARGYGKQGIKSFVVAPGFVQTDMAKQFMDEYGEEIVLNDLALSRLTQPEDIAPTVVLMASGNMDHATGCTIDINAGSYVH